MDSDQHLKTKIEELALVCCKLYISESRNPAALDVIERAARLDPKVALVSKLESRPYNRVCYTLISHVAHDNDAAFRNAVLAMVKAAFAAIDLRTHSGAHPRTGVVDHICFHPLARATINHAAHVAKLIASDIGCTLQVPVFLYEAAHPNGKALDKIRRELGYFQPNLMGHQWSGWALPKELPENPDEGPTQVNPARGLIIIGASPWVENYNIPVLCSNVLTVRKVARLLSARGGGLPAVQALGLLRDDDRMEVACILLEPNRVGADRVQNRVQELAADEGLQVEKGYFTDISQDMIVERYLKMLCDG